MNTIYTQLVDDHRNLSRLLLILSECLREMESTQDWPTEEDLFLEAIDYLTDYPQLYHHPLEEPLLEYLIQEHELGSTLNAIEDQHKILEANGERLKTLCYSGVTSHSDWGSTVHILADYLDLQKQHLEDENVYFLPLVEKLPLETCQTLTAHIKPREDSLFDEEMAQGYPKLRTRLKFYS